MKTGFLITARLKSSRLPMKLMKEVNGSPIISWMIRRLKLANELAEIVICTSTNPQDDPLVEVAEKENVNCFRGSEDDVLERLLSATEAFDFDYVINMTADCPLLPYDLIGDLINTFTRTNADLVKCHHLPSGMFLSGLKPDALRHLSKIKDSQNTEYWLYYFLKTDIFKIEQLKTPDQWLRRGYRICLDYPEDWEVIKAVFESIGMQAFSVTTPDLIQWMDENPDTMRKNAMCGEVGEVHTKNDPASRVKLKGDTIIL